MPTESIIAIDLAADEHGRPAFTMAWKNRFVILF
jgi:hypothetical protein